MPVLYEVQKSFGIKRQKSMTEAKTVYMAKKAIKSYWRAFPI
jgi:hypothetical protein